MAVAILLGLPKPQSDRVRGALNRSLCNWRTGWSVRFVPPTGKSWPTIREADIRSALNQAMQCNDSVHLLVMTNQGGGHKKDIAACFVPQFRLRWLPGKWLELPYPSPEVFVEKVNEALADEDDWIEQVQPRDTKAALLLPKVAFASRMRDLWDLAEKYGEGCNKASARRLIEFQNAHYKRHSSEGRPRSNSWIDDHNLIFDHAGARHGQAPDDRSWKYSYRLPSGFHYDVRHAQDRCFDINGMQRRQSIPAGGYVNIDAHGFFRD